MHTAPIGNTAQFFLAGRHENFTRRSIASRIVEILWADERLMDGFKRNSRGWQNGLASALSISSSDLQRYVKAMGGRENLKRLAFHHPAGPLPFEGMGELAKDPTAVHLVSSTMGCITSGCPTCGCPTSGCPTCGCPTCGNCPTGKSADFLPALAA